MNKRQFWENLTILICVALTTAFFVTLHDFEVDKRAVTIKKLTSDMTEVVEQAYFNGQKDAISGDIRIVMVKDTVTGLERWTWLKSPWNNGQKPVYVP